MRMEGSEEKKRIRKMVRKYRVIEAILQLRSKHAPPLQSHKDDGREKVAPKTEIRVYLLFQCN
jgi:hypothetical protein